MAEEVDAVVKIPIAAGIHLVAMAVMCSAAPGSAELALAGEILRQSPKRSLPREIAGPIDTFNRHMDAAIDSCNDSSGEPTRAARRARLAMDLEREGLVLIEQSTLAELLERELAGDADPFPDEDDGLDEGEDLGAELIDGEHVGDVGRNPLPVPALND